MATTLEAPTTSAHATRQNGTAAGGALVRYLQELNGQTPNPAVAAYYASLDQVASVSPSIAGSIVAELRDQRRNLK
ncbi:MAG TPA: hypothetical protein VFX49_00150, partial [Chloroflexota bacterium]|nr:hypothetical protein [Chloroflexota bacterium]